MTEHEIFEKLKESLDYQYMYDSLEFGDERKEVDNLEDYLRIIKQEREIEKDFEDAELNRLNTYKEFIRYLHDKAIGNTDSIIDCFYDNSVNIFVHLIGEDYPQCTVLWLTLKRDERVAKIEKSGIIRKKGNKYTALGHDF